MVSKWIMCRICYILCQKKNGWLTVEIPRTNRINIGCGRRIFIRTKKVMFEVRRWRGWILNKELPVNLLSYKSHITLKIFGTSSELLKMNPTKWNDNLAYQSAKRTIDSLQIMFGTIHCNKIIIVRDRDGSAYLYYVWGRLRSLPVR